MIGVVVWHQGWPRRDLGFDSPRIPVCLCSVILNQTKYKTKKLKDPKES